MLSYVFKTKLSLKGLSNQLNKYIQFSCFFILLSSERFNFSELSAKKLYEKEVEDNIKLIKGTELTKIRNIAIIAHVDQGKTTVVECMLSQSCGNTANSERVMDSNELEQERGIIKLSKGASITYNGFKINIVYIPGHQNNGGEVEHIMNIVNSVFLVVYVSEGLMLQTRYINQKALRKGLKPIIVINKAERNTARLQEVEDEVFNLFISLDVATDDQIDYTMVNASAIKYLASYVVPGIETQTNSNIILLESKLANRLFKR